MYMLLYFALSPVFYIMQILSRKCFNKLLILLDFLSVSSGEQKSLRVYQTESDMVRGLGYKVRVAQEGK